MFKIGCLGAEDEEGKLCFRRHQDVEHLVSSREVKLRLRRPQRWGGVGVLYTTEVDTPMGDPE